MDKKIVVIAHDIRSTYNVGSLFRTCDGLGINELIITGYSPYPKKKDDGRLPHVIDRAERQISKTALGAEKTLAWQHKDEIKDAIGQLKSAGYKIVALEQSENSKPLNEYKTPNKVALLLGEERLGVKSEILAMCDETVEIPMLGKKESFNVAQAAAIALYHMRFIGI